jgi:adenylate kinase family enzyme
MRRRDVIALICAAGWPLPARAQQSRVYRIGALVIGLADVASFQKELREARMKRVAVFGNAGGGKSTLAKRLAQITGLPLYSVDTIKYKVGGGEVPREQYLTAHADLLLQDEWIIDGFGCVPSAWERFSRADTLIYVDLPVMMHYWWVTKRLIKGLFVNPEGWPKNSPMWRSTMSSYRVIPLCDKRLTPKYRQLVSAEAPHKRIHHLKSRSEIKSFLEVVEREYASMETGSAQPKLQALSQAR